MKRLALALCLAALAAPALDAQDATAPATPSARRRVAVLDFDYGTVQTYVAGLYGSDMDVGKGVATMLVSQLVRTGTYTVIERSQVERILNEQNLGQEGRVDASSAARLGRLLGADAIIMGSITQFGSADKKLGAGGGGIRLGGIGLGGLGRKTSKATVVIDARIVDIGTGEILAVAQGKGESKRSGLMLAAAVGGAGGVVGGVLDMSSSNFASTILGEATRLAVDSLVIELGAAAPKIRESIAAITALVADVSGDQLVINVGTAGGVRIGTEYVVVRPGREIKDPATGNVLRRETAPVGKIKITTADERSATGTLTGDPAHVGDCVGACPLAPPGRQQPPVGQAPTPSAPSAGGAVAIPAVYTGPPSGPFTWTGYAFTGTEHFRYDGFVSFPGQPQQSGFYEVDATPAGSGRVQLRVQGRMGKEAYSMTTTLAPNQAVPTAQMVKLGPAGMALFADYESMFMGHQWQVGEGWQGRSFSFKTESTCQYAGVPGLRGVMRTDQAVMDLCVSPNVGLPLAVTTAYGSGSTGFSYGLKLTQFRP